MLQFNSLIASFALPAAGQTLQTVAQAAQDAGQSFLKTFAQFGEQTVDAASAMAVPETLENKLAAFSEQFRGWLAGQGVTGPYEMQFQLSDNGDPIANVVGQNSEQIVDLLYGDSDWLDRLSSLAAQAGREAPDLPGTNGMGQAVDVTLAVSSEGAYVLRQPSHRFRKSG